MYFVHAVIPVIHTPPQQNLNSQFNKIIPMIVIYKEKRTFCTDIVYNNCTAFSVLIKCVCSTLYMQPHPYE